MIVPKSLINLIDSLDYLIKNSKSTNRTLKDNCDLLLNSNLAYNSLITSAQLKLIYEEIYKNIELWYNIISNEVKIDLIYNALNTQFLKHVLVSFAAFESEIVNRITKDSVINNYIYDKSEFINKLPQEPWSHNLKEKYNFAFLCQYYNIASTIESINQGTSTNSGTICAIFLTSNLLDSESGFLTTTITYNPSQADEISAWLLYKDQEYANFISYLKGTVFPIYNCKKAIEKNYIKDINKELHIFIPPDAIPDIIKEQETEVINVPVNTNEDYDFLTLREC